jgi:hypothetical protein
MPDADVDFIFDAIMIDDLESIPGPKTVGTEGCSEISRAFYEGGWDGFEQAFDRLVHRDRPDYVEVKRDPLREPIFMTRVHQRLARLYLREAMVEEPIEEIERDRALAEPQ